MAHGLVCYQRVKRKRVWPVGKYEQYALITLSSALSSSLQLVASVPPLLPQLVSAECLLHMELISPQASRRPESGAAGRGRKRKGKKRGRPMPSLRGVVAHRFILRC